MQKNNSYDVLNLVISQLTSHDGVTCIPDTGGSEQAIYVNHVKVLVRKSYTENTHVCIELLHEVQGSEWSRSWGLTSDAEWLLHVDHANNNIWYHLPTLRKYITDGISSSQLILRNNSKRTRRCNGTASNVVSVWVDELSECDYMYNEHGNYSHYGMFLRDVIRYV